MLCRGLKFLSVSSFHRKANIRVTIELRTATNPAHKRVRGNGGSLKRQTSRCDTFPSPPLKKIFRPRLLTVSINIDILFHSSLFFWMGSGKHQQSFAFFSVILVLCCLSMNLWIYLTGKWHSVSPPSHLGSLIKINRWFRPIFSLHAPHIGWRFSKVCHFFQLVLLFGLRPAPHVCNEFSVLSHDLFLLLCLLLFFVILQFESPAGSAGGLCFLSSEVHWPAESLLFPANFRKSKVFFVLEKNFIVYQETKYPSKS